MNILVKGKGIKYMGDPSLVLIYPTKKSNIFDDIKSFSRPLRGYLKGCFPFFCHKPILGRVFLESFLLNMVKTLEIPYGIRYVLPVFEGERGL
ncbi:MAG: hypothetical protein ACI9S8_000157 [Chlamydiales bacterium]